MKILHNLTQDKFEHLVDGRAIVFPPKGSVAVSDRAGASILEAEKKAGTNRVSEQAPGRFTEADHKAVDELTKPKLFILCHSLMNGEFVDVKELAGKDAAPTQDKTDDVPPAGEGK